LAFVIYADPDALHQFKRFFIKFRRTSQVAAALCLLRFFENSAKLNNVCLAPDRLFSGELSWLLLSE